MIFKNEYYITKKDEKHLNRFATYHVIFLCLVDFITSVYWCMCICWRINYEMTKIVFYYFKRITPHKSLITSLSSLSLYILWTSFIKLCIGQWAKKWRIFSKILKLKIQSTLLHPWNKLYAHECKLPLFYLLPFYLDILASNR